eukprot:UC1_evm1s974
MFSTDFEEVARTHTTAEKRATQHLSSNWDDAEGYYKLTMGEVIDGRYVVSAFMGSGVFSGVVRALDRRNKDAPVAIKILRNNDLMYKAGLKELAVCQSLQAADPDGRAHCVRFIRSLTHRNHLCLVFEALGLNLRDVCRRYGRDHGLNIRAVRAYTGQLLQALHLMHSIGHLHADIKPDNILVNEAKNVCKLADFGSAFPVEENDPTPYLASRYYRAPEIILGHRYSYGADMWALACTLYELATGQILFAGTSNNDMLRAILELYVNNVNKACAAKTAMDEKDSRDWTRAYLMQMSSGSSGSDSGSDHSNSASGDELSSSAQQLSTLPADIGTMYREALGRMAALRFEASAAKKAGDNQAKRDLGHKIMRARTRLGQLERADGFVRPLDDERAQIESEAVAEAAARIAKASAESDKEKKGEEGEEGSNSGVISTVFDMFSDQDLGDEGNVVSSSVDSGLEVRRVELKTWSGIAPQDLLGEWARRTYGRDTMPRFARISEDGRGAIGATSRGLHRHRVSIRTGRGDGDWLRVDGPFLAHTAAESKSVAAAAMLYQHARDDGSRRRLPPDLRDIWDSWVQRDAEVAQSALREALGPREELVAKLMESEPSGVASALSWTDVEGPTSAASITPYPPQSRTRRYRISDADLALRFKTRQSSSSAYRAMQLGRQELPVSAFREEIISAVVSNQVVVISGETGCGKTTQIPQYLLEHVLTQSPDKTVRAQIICTQPRRISAVSIAARVCTELGDTNGPGASDSLCGYHVRMDNRQGKDTRLVYCTTGIVLRRLQNDPGLCDVTHLIVDEVHERSVQADFLLVVLRRLLPQRPDLRVVLMSATMDSERVAAYFGGCPIIAMPGRTFPVQTFFLEDAVELTGYVVDKESPYYNWDVDDAVVARAEAEVMVDGCLENENGGDLVGTDWANEVELGAVTAEEGDMHDTAGAFATERITLSRGTMATVARMNHRELNYDLVEAVLELIEEPNGPYAKIDGAVLVFLPGMGEIQQLYTRLASHTTFHDESRFRLVPLAGALAASEQSAAFSSPPPGVRKIVLATNVAETGVTIPDVVFVVDSARVKETRYREAARMSSLTTTHVSKASARQRAGRAGRVRAGFCFRLVTRTRWSRLAAHTTPEIRRVPLEPLCLHILATGMGQPGDVLSAALDPPQIGAVGNALGALCEVGAVRSQGSNATHLVEKSTTVARSFSGGRRHPSTTAVELTALGEHLARLPVDVHL